MITVNSGSAESKKFGALTHIGQDETIAGEAVGDELNKRGRKKALCVLHEQGNVGHEQRCAGRQEDLRRHDGEPLRRGHQHARRAVLHRGQAPGRPGHRHRRHARRPVRRHRRQGHGAGAGSKAEIDTFDLNAKVAAALKDGTLGFAVDQQPYLQGYEAVDLLWLYSYNADVARRRQAGPHRPADRHQGRAPPKLRAVRQAGHPMSAARRTGPPHGRPTSGCCETSPLRSLLGRPELGSVVGAARRLRLLRDRRRQLPAGVRASAPCCTRPPPSASWRCRSRC